MKNSAEPSFCVHRCAFCADAVCGKVTYRAVYTEGDDEHDEGSELVRHLHGCRRDASCFAAFYAWFAAIHPGGQAVKLAQRSSTQEMDVLCERPDDGASAQTAHRRTGNPANGAA